ncbi:hypothetical protein FDUTEX481_06168 [Tolypothrix sp. PCC 7601]|nr:hypothetical protein FDUTEX481_06168 [Tolypothrix sp. PCC 7601]
MGLNPFTQVNGIGFLDLCTCPDVIAVFLLHEIAENITLTRLQLFY